MQGFIWFTVIVFLILAVFSGFYIYYSNNYIKPLLLGERRAAPRSADTPPSEPSQQTKTEAP